MTSRLLVIAIACALTRIPHAAADPAPTGAELYQQAVAAFIAGDNGAALSLATRAVVLPGRLI